MDELPDADDSQKELLEQNQPLSNMERPLTQTEAPESFLDENGKTQDDLPLFPNAGFNLEIQQESVEPPKDDLVGETVQNQLEFPSDENIEVSCTATNPPEREVREKIEVEVSPDTPKGFDPCFGLPFTDQVAKYDYMKEIYVPYDVHDYIQVLQHPTDPKMFFTVQLVSLNVKHLSQEVKTGHEFMHCLKCTQKLKLFRREKTQHFDCTNCSQKILERAYYSCFEPEKAKKSGFPDFRKSFLKVFSEAAEDQAVENQIESKDDCETTVCCSCYANYFCYQKQVEKNKLHSKWTFSDKSHSKGDDQLPKTDQVALIGVWQNGDEQPECVAQSFLENPILFPQEATKEKVLLHIDERKQIFVFQRCENKDIKISRIKSWLPEEKDYMLRQVQTCEEQLIVWDDTDHNPQKQELSNTKWMKDIFKDEGLFAHPIETMPRLVDNVLVVRHGGAQSDCLYWYPNSQLLCYNMTQQSWKYYDKGLLLLGTQFDLFDKSIAEPNLEKKSIKYVFIWMNLEKLVCLSAKRFFDPEHTNLDYQIVFSQKIEQGYTYIEPFLQGKHLEGYLFDSCTKCTIFSIDKKLWLNLKVEIKLPSSNKEEPQTEEQIEEERKALVSFKEDTGCEETLNNQQLWSCSDPNFETRRVQTEDCQLVFTRFEDSFQIFKALKKTNGPEENKKLQVFQLKSYSFEDDSTVISQLYVPSDFFTSEYSSDYTINGLIFKKEESTTSKLCTIFNFQSNKKMQKTLLLASSKEQFDMKEPKLLENKHQVLNYEECHTEFPLLLQSTYHPSQNRFTITNLVQNRPKTVIQLQGQTRLVKFVYRHSLSDSAYTQIKICMLVQVPDKPSCLHLIGFTAYPFFSEEDLVNQPISIDYQDYHMEIQEMPENDHTIRMAFYYEKLDQKLLMIQTSEDIRVYLVEKRLEVENQTKIGKLAPVTAVLGHDLSFFCVHRHPKSGDSVVVYYLDANKLQNQKVTQQVLFNQEEKIVSIYYNSVGSELILIDETGKIKRLKIFFKAETFSAELLHDFNDQATSVFDDKKGKMYNMFKQSVQDWASHTFDPKSYFLFTKSQGQFVLNLSTGHLSDVDEFGYLKFAQYGRNSSEDRLGICLPSPQGVLKTQSQLQAGSLGVIQIKPAVSHKTIDLISASTKKFCQGMHFDKNDQIVMIFEERHWITFDLVTLMLLDSFNFECSQIVESNDALKQKFVLTIGDHPDLAHYATVEKRKILKTQFGLVPKREEQLIQKIFNQDGLKSSSNEGKFVFQSYQESQMLDSKGNSVNLWICQKKGSQSKRTEQLLDADPEENYLVKIVKLTTKVEEVITNNNSSIQAQDGEKDERKQQDPNQSIIDQRVHILTFEELEEKNQGVLSIVEENSVEKNEKEKNLAKVAKVNRNFDQGFDWEEFLKLPKSEQVNTIPEALFSSFEPLEEVNCSEHEHTLKKLPPRNSGWRCNRLNGVDFCKGGLTELNKSDGVNSWSCKDCDFNFCKQCLQIDLFFSATTQKQEVQVEKTEVNDETLNYSYLIFDQRQEKDLMDKMQFKMQVIQTKNYLVWTTPGLVNCVKLAHIDEQMKSVQVEKQNKDKVKTQDKKQQFLRLIKDKQTEVQQKLIELKHKKDQQAELLQTGQQILVYMAEIEKMSREYNYNAAKEQNDKATQLFNTALQMIKNIKAVPVQQIDLRQMFLKDYQDKFNIFTVGEEERKFLMRDEKLRPDLIQIRDQQISVIWDLDEFEEVTYLGDWYMFSEHANLKNFVRTGHQLSIDRNKECTEIITNSDNSYYLVNEISKEAYQNQFKCFRSYCQMDLQFFQFISRRNMESQNIKNEEMYYQAVNANIYGRTFFTLFYKDHQVIDRIRNQTLKKDKEPVQGQDEIFQEFDQIALRQLYQILLAPAKIGNKNYDQSKIGLYYKMNKINNEIAKSSIASDKEFLKKMRVKNQKTKLDKNLDKVTTIVQYSLHNDPLLFNYLCQIICSLRECRLSNVVCTFDDFSKIFEIKSASCAEFLNKSYIQTGYTQKINVLEVRQADEVIFFEADTPLLNDNVIEQEFKKKMQERDDEEKVQTRFFSYFGKKKPELSLQPFLISVLETEFMGDKIKSFVEKIANTNDEQLFENKLIKFILDQLDFTQLIILAVFVPYLLYASALLYYYSFVLTDPDQTNLGFFKGQGFSIFLRIAIVILTGFFAYIEVCQLKYNWRLYMNEFIFNFGYWLFLFVNLWIVVNHSNTKSDVKSYIGLSQAASVMSIPIWLNFYFWLRVFPRTAIYVEIINQTIIDIGPFVLVVVMCLCMFGNATIILDEFMINNKDQDSAAAQYEPLIQEQFSRMVPDAFVAQYLSALGQFSVDSFSTNPSKILVWIYLIGSTFITNVVIFNMLINVMATTYDRVREFTERNTLKMKTKIQADNLFLLKNPQLGKRRYLYLAEPILPETDASFDVISVVKSISAQVKQGFENEDYTQKKILEMLPAIVQAQTELKQRQDEVIEGTKNLIEKYVGELERKNTEKMATIEQSLKLIADSLKVKLA